MTKLLEQALEAVRCPRRWAGGDRRRASSGGSRRPCPGEASSSPAMPRSKPPFAASTD